MPVSQGHTLRLLTALRFVRPAWGGALFLGIGLNGTGRAMALASLAAGAAGLFLEDDADELRLAQREGCCTFSVTTLDEALRALKNEIRQRRAITVALRGGVSRWLDEAVERGVMPGTVATSRALTGAELQSVVRLQGWGAAVIGGCGLPACAGAIELDDILPAATQGWRIEEDLARSPAERRERDRAELAAPMENDAAAQASRAFLHAAATLFPRSLERARWVREP